MNMLGIRTMTILTNARWEQFAQRVAGGESAAAAYRATYNVTGPSADSAASRLLGKGEIASRVARLREQAAGVSAVEQAKAAGKAAGLVVLALAKKRQLLHAFATARKLDVKDRLRAIELDARLAGELKNGEGAAVNVGVAVKVVTNEEIREAQARKRASIERRRLAAMNATS